MFPLPILVYSLFPLAIIATNPLVTYKIDIPTTVKKLLNYPEDSLLNFTQIVTKYGYKAEEHNVTTEDGYILTIFRMTGGNCSTTNKIPVILMHGIFLDAYVFVDAGVNASLPYLLADSCYDVWLGNNRGTPGGRAHNTLDPDKDALFWQFSLDEMGMYDVPAIIDTVLNLTGSEKVNHIGYSQGAGTFAIALSENPEYNSKINLNIGLAPGIRIKATKSPVFRLIGVLYYLLEDVLSTVGIQESLFRGSIIQVLLEFICHDVTLTKPLCLSIYTLLDSFNPGSIQDDTLKLSFSHLFAGGSVQSYVKVYQWQQNGTFIKYDYGAEKNLELYGTEWPGTFDISLMKVPSVFFTSENDHVVVPEDVIWATERIPNFLELVYINDTNWNHFDYIFSHFIPTLLYPKLNEYLSNYS